MPLTPGSRVGPYEVLSPLGSGGMGVVYLAHDPRLQRNVALKVLPASLTGDPDAKRQLLNEARAAAALNHPNICTIHEVGEADGQTFIAMEVVEGESLSMRVARDKAVSTKSIRLGVQLAGALEHGHQRGVVHGDLKSANIMVTPAGAVKVVDFGLAARRPIAYDVATHSEVPLEHDGGIGGTLPYMSPQLLRGGRADARSDIWALGVVLYEMVTGHLPFTRTSTADLTSAILRDGPAAFSPRVPAALATVIQRCLEKDPFDRYERAGEVRAALELIQSEQSSEAVMPALRRVVSTFQLRSGAGVAVLLSLLAAAGIAALIVQRDREPSTPSLRAGPSIAVLPFDNLSRDPSQEYFSDGMTEALITDLAKVSALKVISRTSIMRYKGGERKPLPQIARELNVDTIIEGTVLTVADRVRVSVNLVDGPSDRHLWTDSFERDLSNILVLQSDIARAVASRVRAQLTGLEKARLSNPKAVDPRAHELYLRGRYLTQRSSPEALNKAIEYLERATRAQPDFAPAYAALALAHQQRDIWGGLRIGASDAKARSAAEQALALDDTLAEAHLALAILHFNHDWDWPAAEASFQRALSLNPSLPDAYMHRAYPLQALGRDDEAIASTRRAVELDPRSARWLSDEGRMHYRAHRFEEAIERYQSSLELDPVYLPPLSRIAEAYEQLGRFQEALAALNRVAQIEGRRATRMLARVYARMGKTEDALTLVREIEGDDDPSALYALASIHAALGDLDRAVGYLDRAVHERSILPFQLRDPSLDALRRLPRFQALLRRAHLPL